MIWDGMIVTSKTSLIFMERHMEVNKDVHPHNVLEATLVAFVQQHLENQEWTFQ